MAATHASDDILVQDLMHVFWRHKILAFLFTFGCTAAVLVATYLVPKGFTATATVAVVASNLSDQEGVLGALTSNISAITGVALTSDPKKVESVGVLQSDALTERFIRTRNLLPILYPDLWDEHLGRWKTSDPSKVPTLWKAGKYFRKDICKVTIDAKTGLVTVAVTWKDPKVATDWANGFIQMANDVERDNVISRAEIDIAYLKDQASKTDVVEIRKAIYSLLESAFKKEMLARGNPEYAFKSIDPALAPEKYSYPAKLVWLLTTVFLSLSISIFAAFFLVAWQKD